MFDPNGVNYWDYLDVGLRDFSNTDTAPVAESNSEDENNED
jgi:hypothetical protein